MCVWQALWCRDLSQPNVVAQPQPQHLQPLFHHRPLQHITVHGTMHTRSVVTQQIIASQPRGHVRRIVVASGFLCLLPASSCELLLATEPARLTKSAKTWPYFVTLPHFSAV